MASPTEDLLVIKDNVKFMKATFNYFQPFVIWKETYDQLKDKKRKASDKTFDDGTDEDKLYLIMSSTRDYLCHLCCLTDKKYITHMHLNMKNLYEVFGVDLAMKRYQRDFLYKDIMENSDEKNNYYYFNKWVDFTNLSGITPKEVNRAVINDKIKEIISTKHDSPLIGMSDNKRETINLFAHVVHHLVGTRYLEWDKITKYFDCFVIKKSEETIANNQKLSIFLQRGNNTDVEFNDGYKRIEDHWNEMDKTSKSEIIDIKIMKLKEMFNPEPFEVWNNLHKKLKNIDKCPEEDKNIINILISTKKILSGTYNFMDQEGRYRIFFNLKYLYKFFRINFKDEEKMKKFETQANLTVEENKYYFYNWQYEGETNKEHGRSVSRETVNKEIIDLIKRGYKATMDQSQMDVASENIILFGYLLHLFEGNSLSITKYFSNYCICHCENGTKIELRITNGNFIKDYDELMNVLKDLQLDANAT